MSTEFKWTADLLAEFIRDYADMGSNAAQLMEQFKASKQPKQEWEILSYLSSTFPDRYVIDQNHLGWNNAVIRNMEIYSVKRLSDGHMFTLQDETVYGKIKCFMIEGQYMYAGFEGETEGGYVLLHHIELKKVLFTTEDGKDIYKGDRAWFVDKVFKVDFYDFIYMGNLQEDLKHYPDIYKYFSTKEKAEEYILWNKPLFSLKEIHANSGVPDTNPYFQKIVQIARNKMNNQ